MRRWELLSGGLDPAGRAPLFLQVSNAIAEDIRRGRLRPGDALPGTRVLAQRLGVHRNTVIAGYQELVAQGLAWARPGGGTFVAPAGAAPLPVRPGPVHAEPTYVLRPGPDPTPMTPPDPGGALMLFRAVPDVRLLPSEALARAYRRALGRHGRKLLGYADPRGHAQLRREIATMIAHARGIAATADDVVVTRGSQQGLFLAAQVLLGKGDRVAVEALGNPLVWRALASTGATLEPVPVDADGLDVAALEAALARGPLRAVYVTPHHQFPTNAVMGPARRARLAVLAREHRFVVLEDDYDHEFHYEGRPVAPLAAGPGAANVVYVGSLSKVLAPGLRVGYVVAPPAILGRLVAARAVCDMQGDATVECAVAELFADGELVRHVRRMTRAYERRRDALADALARELPEVLRFRVPAGGMALWCEVTGGVDLPAWTVAAERLGVLFRGAQMFDFDRRPLPFLRLGFTSHDEAELADAAARMAQALRGEPARRVAAVVGARPTRRRTR